MPVAGESEYYPIMPYNHEEFGTRVMLHAMNAVSRGYKRILILEWTTSLDTSSRTLYWNGQLAWTPALGLYL